MVQLVNWSTIFFTKLCICRSNVLLLLPVKIHAFSEGPLNKAFTAAFFKSVLQDPALIRTSWLGASCLQRSGPVAQCPPIHQTSKWVWMCIYCMRWMSIYHIRWQCVCMRWIWSKRSATSQQIRRFLEYDYLKEYREFLLKDIPEKCFSVFFSFSSTPWLIEVEPVQFSTIYNTIFSQGQTLIILWDLFLFVLCFMLIFCCSDS